MNKGLLRKIKEEHIRSEFLVGNVGKTKPHKPKSATKRIFKRKLKYNIVIEKKII